MKFPLFVTLRNYKLKYLPKDIISGIIVAAMTIPISMGYAQVCGMPPVSRTQSVPQGLPQVRLLRRQAGSRRFR